MDPLTIWSNYLAAFLLRLIIEIADGFTCWGYIYICVCGMYTCMCPGVSSSLDCSPPGSSVHGIFQARILEWDAISFSRGSSPPKYQTLSPASPALIGDPLQQSHPGITYVWLTITLDNHFMWHVNKSMYIHTLWFTLWFLYVEK